MLFVPMFGWHSVTNPATGKCLLHLRAVPRRRVMPAETPYDAVNVIQSLWFPRTSIWICNLALVHSGARENFLGKAAVAIFTDIEYRHLQSLQVQVPAIFVSKFKCIGQPCTTIQTTWGQTIRTKFMEFVLRFSKEHTGSSCYESMSQDYCREI